jgi:alkylhydroperoxidase family enzyme
MNPFISPPKHIPLILRIGIWFSKRVTGKDLLPARLLAWYPKAAIGSGALEALVAHEDGELNQRILKLVRMQASFAAACPFCVDMNSFEYEHYQISPDELRALQGGVSIDQITSFSEREQLAIQYARLISQTPLQFPKSFIDRLKEHFTEREIVILASTAAQVNYWARLIQALGVPPAGFSDQCLI